MIICNPLFPTSQNLPNDTCLSQLNTSSLSDLSANLKKLIEYENNNFLSNSNLNIECQSEKDSHKYLNNKQNSLSLLNKELNLSNLELKKEVDYLSKLY